MKYIWHNHDKQILYLSLLFLFFAHRIGIDYEKLDGIGDTFPYILI